MHEAGNNKIKTQFEQLLKLFDEILEQSEDYHIVYFPKLGHIAIDGKYMPGCKSDTVLSKIMFQQYFPTPKDMAYSLMENLRWQWYMQNGRPSARMITSQYWKWIMSFQRENIQNIFRC